MFAFPPINKRIFVVEPTRALVEIGAEKKKRIPKGIAASFYRKRKMEEKPFRRTRLERIMPAANLRNKHFASTAVCTYWN